MDGVFAVLGLSGSLRKGKKPGLSYLIFRIIIMISLLILLLMRWRLVIGYESSLCCNAFTCVDLARSALYCISGLV